MLLADVATYKVRLAGVLAQGEARGTENTNEMSCARCPARRKPDA